MRQVSVRLAAHQCKKSSATETQANKHPIQVMGGDPVTRLLAVLLPMKTKGITHREAFDPTELLTSSRHPVRIGARKVRTMWETGKTAQALKEMKDCKIGILDLCETRWTQQS